MYDIVDKETTVRRAIPLSKPYHLTVNVYATYFSVVSDMKGWIVDQRYDLGNNFLCLLKIPLFNNKGEYLGATRYYSYNDGEFRIPVKTLPLVQAYLDSIRSVEPLFSYSLVYHDPVSGEGRRSSEYTMNQGWKDREEHKEAFAHLLGYEGTMVGTNLQTGKGKSYLGVKMSIIGQVPTLICCDGLVDQWIENYVEKTNIPKEKMCVIQGASTVDKLWKLIGTGKELPRILVGSIRTLSLYRKYEGPYTQHPRLSDLCKALDIGTIIYDEIHLNTNAIVLLMTEFNSARNIFLSATPERSDKEQQKIFKMVFPKGMISGSSAYDRYVESSIYPFEVDLNASDKAFEMYGYGYSHTKYESKLMHREDKLNSLLSHIRKNIHSEYITKKTKGDKCLIFVSTVRLAEVMTKHLRAKFPGCDVRSYTASDPIDNLDADIIISTPKGCGTGKDLKNLITVINTVSMNSSPGYQQMLGRLRKLEGKSCRFIDMINVAVSAQLRHFYNNKRKVLKNLSASYDDARMFEMVKQRPTNSNNGYYNRNSYNRNSGYNPRHRR